jgi:hypothetical protein
MRNWCAWRWRKVLRYDDERHWLRAAAARVGHLFPRLLRQSETTTGSRTLRR